MDAGWGGGGIEECVVYCLSRAWVQCRNAISMVEGVRIGGIKKRVRRAPIEGWMMMRKLLKRIGLVSSLRRG